jgi:hypothetical protein
LGRQKEQFSDDDVGYSWIEAVKEISKDVIDARSQYQPQSFECGRFT